MGVLRTVVNTLVCMVGGVLILTAQTFYQVLTPVPAPPGLEPWPKHFSQKQIDDTVGERRFIIQALQGPKDLPKLFPHLTDGFVYETPLYLIKGRDNFILFSKRVSEYIGEYTVSENLGEYHNASEILLDYNIKYGFKGGQKVYHNNCRFSVAIDPSKKVSKVTEMWNGNVLLNSDNNFFRYIPFKFRTFIGNVALGVVNKGWV